MDGNLKSCIHTMVVGSTDSSRRVFSAIREHFPAHQASVRLSSTASARADLTSGVPDIVLVEISNLTTASDLSWTREFLTKLRERYQKSMSVGCLITSPHKFVFAGDLLFNNLENLSPSGLIDSIIITPPPGIPSSPTIEEQTINFVSHIRDLRSTKPATTLPSLWEENWVPVMCAPKSRDVWLRWLPRYASYTNENPLIVGPTGAGKTRLAAAIHDLSGRTGPFICITPRDFSSSELVQAELFGAVAGAYTGAVDKWGLVKKAEKGTLFIDELQSIDRDLQGKLITFIENKSYRRVGEAESNSADVRFIFATNRPLAELVEDGSLRDDFAYRLERLKINLAPISERRLDIAAAICFGLAKVLRERNRLADYQDRILEGLSLKAYRKLFSMEWPGNLRQLENTIAKLVELADISKLRLIDEDCIEQTLGDLLGHREITSSDIFEKSAFQTARSSRAMEFSDLEDCAIDLKEKIRSNALTHTGGEVEQAAKLVGDSVKAMTLFQKSRDKNETQEK